MMELYTDLVLAEIYFKFNIHYEYTLFQSEKLRESELDNKTYNKIIPHSPSHVHL